MKSEKPKRRVPLIVGGVCLIIITLFLAILFLPFNSLGQAIVYQTQTTTATRISAYTTTSASVETAVSSITTFVTVTRQLPPSVTLSGDVKTPGIGINNVTPTNVIFTSTGTNSSVFQAMITGSHYSVQLPNQQTYQVKIHYTISPVGSGDCNVGAFLVDTTEVQITANLQC